MAVGQGFHKVGIWRLKSPLTALAVML